MKDLYDELGVSHDAPLEEIKKSYRKKATEHHPDKGGSSENFRAIATAYQILGSKENRERYDKGESWENILQGSPDTIPLKTLGEMFINLVDQIPDGFPVSVFDLVRKNVAQGQAEADKQKRVLEASIKKYEKTKKKIKVKKGENLFNKLLDAKVRDCETNIQKLAEQRRIGDRMLEILEDYEFEVETGVTIMGYTFTNTGGF